MKTKLLFLLAFCMPIIFFAQNGINYKAVIKDNLGNIVANDLVVVQFTILKGVAQTNVYRETHTPTTDANGIIIVNIGEGTFISGNYNTINWSNDTYYLNTQINIGSGLVDMGTTQFKTVPYALSAANVQGLERVDEGNNYGWRLVGRNPDRYGNIGTRAIDLSASLNNSTTLGATGFYATALGVNTTSSGDLATALGNSTLASGFGALATGQNTTASGVNSTATGFASIAAGETSTAIGNYAIAASYQSIALGSYNLVTGTTDSWIPTDPLLVVGNGTGLGTQSNALSILKNGTITAPSLTNALITTAGAKALITKEYAEANLVSTGLELLNEGSGTGWRLKGRNPGSYGDIGNNAVDFSTSQELIDIGALGTYSFAAGRDTRAQGGISTAMGSNTVASGESSTALGAYTNATGLATTSMGYYSNATGLYSLAAGVYTRANAYNSTAIGAFNLGGGNATTWVATDPLFEIGNGTTGSTRANAVTVLKNGNVGIGVSNPIAKLQTNGRIQFGNQEYIEDGGTFIITVNGGLVSTINGVDNLGSATNRWNTVYATNGVINTSDSRDKTNITDLNYGLNELMKLKPVSYNWKTHPNEDKKLGLIAQELLQIIPEVVKTHEQIAIDDNDRTKTKSVEMDRMGVYYSDLIPVLIKAIQEQQVTIESLKARIELLEND